MKHIYDGSLRLFVITVILSGLFSGQLTFAQEPCGNIIAPESFFNISSSETTTSKPYTDCADPFVVTKTPASPYSLSINGKNIIDGEVVSVSEGSTSNIVLSGEPILSSYDNYLFKQVDKDYVYTEQTFLGPNRMTITEPGKYIMVIKDYQMSVSDNSQKSTNPFLKHIKFLKDFVIPTAHAQYFDGPYTFAIAFTITELLPEPNGASSVLFLPGIMGSRLYEDGEFCSDNGLQRELWFSLSECQQLRLKTSFTGQSINSIFTKSGPSGILDETLTLNIYKTFLKQLEDWQEEGVINDYAAVPYDWRGELDDILKSKLDDLSGKISIGNSGDITDGVLYKTLTQLASSSKNGKVTIVAHSNGGLVIKQLLSNLQNTNDPLLSKIDNVILVAVPQLGAPNAAIGILQGEELDPVMTQATTRSLMNTMPFSHHLLPTSKYFESVQTPVINIEAGEATNPWVDSFDDLIKDRDSLHNFLSKDSGRPKPAFADLETPEVVDNLLLNYAKTTEVVQGNFVPSVGTKIYQIAGTGLETPATLVYFSDKECISRSFLICTEYRPKISYRVEMTIDGDATVPLPSALALATSTRVERRWLDLPSYNSSGILGTDNINRKHKDILEVPDVINFISNIIQSTTTLTYEYLSDASPVLDEGERLIFQLHSPLDMLVMNAKGKIVSSSTSDIKGATYRRFGELQYISIPRTESVTLLLNGESTGSFTLDIEAKKGEESSGINTYTAVPSSSSTKVILKIDKDTALEDLVIDIDYDGDGTNDVTYGTEGLVVEKITYEDLYKLINKLNISKIPKLLLLSMVQTAEKFYIKSLINSKYQKLEEASLRLLSKQTILYERLRLISKEQRLVIEDVIIKLINK